MKRLLVILFLFAACGKIVPTKYVSYYIFAGQSNCGRAWFPGNGKNGPVVSANQIEMYGKELTDIYIFNYRYDTGALHPLQAGINTMLYNYASKNEFGAEVSLFTSFNDAGYKNMYLTKLGYGNTNLATMWIPGGQCNKLLKQQVHKTIDLIKAEGKIPILKSFIWMQGENDAIVPAYANAYYNNLVLFFSDFDAWYKPTLPYKKVICRVSDFADTIGSVRKAQEKYCSDYHAVLLNTDSYERYGVHYDANGLIQFGNDLYNILK